MVQTYMLTHLIVLLLVSPSFALSPDDEPENRTGTLNGYVSEAATGEVIWGVNAVLNGTTLGASTNSSGFYSISRIPPGEYTVVFSFLGFREYRAEVTISAGETTRLDAELIETGLEMDDVLVTSEYFDQEARQSLGVTTVSTQLIRDTPAVLQADVFRSIQLLPGIKAASDFSSGLYIRGGSPDQTLILLDNTTVYNPTHFFGFFSTFNPDAIRDVRVFKGGFPAEYGGRIGSVVDIYNKDGNRREMRGTASVGLLSSRASIEGPFNRGSYMFALRRSTLEPLLWALQGSVENIPESFYFVDANAKINYDLSNTDRLSLSLYAGQDDVNFPASDDLFLKLNYGNITSSLTWRRILSGDLFSTVTFTGSRYFNSPRFEFGGTVFERSNTVNDLSVKADLEWTPSQQHTVKGGIWAGTLLVTLEDRFDGLVTQSPDITSEYISAYLQDQWRITPQWIFTGGLRASYYTSGNHFRLEPRTQLEYRPTAEIRLQTAYGRYYQFKTLITNEAFSGFDLWLLTDDGVPPAWGDQFLAGVKWNPVRQWTFELEGFYRNMRQLFEFDPRIPDTAGLDYNELFRFGEGFAYGVETLIQRNTGRLNGFIGYTWGTTRRKFPTFNNDEFYPPKYDRIHDINLVTNYRLSEKWMATAVFSYATGQTYTEPLGRTQIDNPFGTEPDNPLIVGRVNASRLPAYHRLDFGLTYYSTFFGLGDSELQLQVINAYSRRNVWFYNFDFDDNPVTRQDIRMLPILPSVTYTVNF
ncbi:MAG: TonB-dependent receptor [Balneolia bacterium]|nr:TonB-dependent receptor [Balneolia bacterium]